MRVVQPPAGYRPLGPWPSARLAATWSPGTPGVGRVGLGRPQPTYRSAKLISLGTWSGPWAPFSPCPGPPSRPRGDQL